MTFKPFEGFVDCSVSFLLELVGTFVLLLVIFANCKPDGPYRKALSFGGSGLYTAGFIVTGFTLIALLYTMTLAFQLTGVSAGQMFPLITIPAMFDSMGILSVSLGKGFVLLAAQGLATVGAWTIVFA